MRKIWEAWKTKWNVESNKRMVWIFVIFSITGSLTLVVRKSLYSLLGIDIDSAVLALMVKIIAIYIIYQALLFIVGTLMGEYRFVKWFLLKMNKRLIPFRTQ